MSTEKVIEPKDAHILVVEDNLQNMLLLSRLLDHIGVKSYQWKASGWQMFEVVEEMPRVDVILLDINLPQENGYEVLAKIKADPRLSETRVIAVTADAHPETMKKAQEAGFDGFLGKPIKPANFPTQLVDILQGKAIWNLGQN